MELKTIPYRFTVCKLMSVGDLPSGIDFCFTAKTDEEISLRKR